jgi:hypothetical protein
LSLEGGRRLGGDGGLLLDSSPGGGRRVLLGGRVLEDSGGEDVGHMVSEYTSPMVPQSLGLMRPTWPMAMRVKPERSMPPLVPQLLLMSQYCATVSKPTTCTACAPMGVARPL